MIFRAITNQLKNKEGRNLFLYFLRKIRIYKVYVSMYIQNMNSETPISIANFPLDPVIASSIRISVMELVLSSYVTLNVTFFNSQGNPVKNEMVRVEGSEYAGWGLNDSYLTNIVLQRFGLTLSA
jgi:hypothetical protein